MDQGVLHRDCIVELQSADILFIRGPATQESSGNDFVCANPVTWGPNRRAILSTSQINFEQQNAAITEHIWLVRNAVSRILAERVPSYIDKSDLYSVGHEELVYGVAAQLRNSGSTRSGLLGRRIRKAMIRHIQKRRGDFGRSIPLDPPPYPGDDAPRLKRLEWFKYANGLGKQYKEVYTAARVGRTSFWKWKKDLLPDSSEISQRIEKLLKMRRFSSE